MTSTLESDPGAADAGLTCDAFLGGRVRLWQPARGYRAGVDPVLLAASVEARPGQQVLDLGCGVGAAALCLLARVPGTAVTGLELQDGYADLARRNADLNGARFAVVSGDLTRMPDDLRQRSFDHVMMNPPYFAPEGGTGSVDAGRDTALRGETPVVAWIDAATRRLLPGGTLTLIQRTPRLRDVLGGIDDRLGSIAVAPIAGRAGRPASRFLLRARKGGRSPFRLMAPVVLHHGAVHGRDAEDYCPEIANVLRNAAPLFPFSAQ